MKQNVDKSTTVVGDINIPLLKIDRAAGRKSARVQNSITPLTNRIYLTFTEHATQRQQNTYFFQASTKQISRQTL